MATDKAALDRAIEAFKTYKDKGRLDLKEKIERIRLLETSQKATSARLDLTR